MTNYMLAEKFRSIQGEGLYTGCPMVFIRLTGCSVGKKICSHCDTDFDAPMPWRGGGEFTARQLLDWAEPYRHICISGGEPLDWDLSDIFAQATPETTFHIETSGTKPLAGNLMASPLLELPEDAPEAKLPRLWICVSPKPGFLEESVMLADEVKVIVPGLGSDDSLQRLQFLGASTSPGHPLARRELTFRWPVLADALRWADAGKLVYIQPRNGRFEIDRQNLRIVQDILIDHPNLRLSTQMHKVLHVQ